MSYDHACFINVVVVRLVGCTAKFSEATLETAYGSEMNIQSTGSGCGGLYPQSMARSLKTISICGIELCEKKPAHFRVNFHREQPKAHLCNDHAV